MAELIGGYQTPLLRQGRAATMRRWLADLPKDELARHPGALIAAATVAGGLLRPQAEVERTFAATERGREEHPDTWTPVHDTLLEVVRAATGDADVAAALRAGERALAGADGQNLVLALAAVASARQQAGDRVGAREAAARAITDPGVAEHPHSHASALATLAMLDAQDGQLGSARERADEALAVVRATGNAGNRVELRALLADAMVARAEGRLTHAEKRAEQALAFKPSAGYRARVLLELAEIHLARGRLGPAAQTLAEARVALAGVP